MRPLLPVMQSATSFLLFLLFFFFLTAQCQPLPASLQISSTSATLSLYWGQAAIGDSGQGHRRSQPGGRQGTSLSPTPKSSAGERGGDNPMHLHPATQHRGTTGPWHPPRNAGSGPAPSWHGRPALAGVGRGLVLAWVHGKSGVRPAGRRQPPRQVTGGARGRLHLALAIRGVIKHGAPSCHTFLNK